MILTSVAFVWILGYFVWRMQYEYNLIKNTAYTNEGFYRSINEKWYGTPKDIINSVIDWLGFSAPSSEWNGIYYCSQVRTEKNNIKWMGSSYIQIGNNIFSAGEKIASCEQNNCTLSEKIPNLFYDGKNTFYKWELLSWFDYSSLVLLDEVFSVFTDKNKVYFQWTELPEMDWTTFSHPKKHIQEFKDKNYTYTFVSTWTGMQVQRIENEQL